MHVEMDHQTYLMDVVYVVMLMSALEVCSIVLLSYQPRLNRPSRKSFRMLNFAASINLHEQHSRDSMNGLL